MPFVLGVRGNRWAWRNGRWDSTEHFRRVQRAWTKWAVIIYVGAIVLFGAIFGGAFYLLSHSEAYRLGVANLEASAEVANLLGKLITTGLPAGKISTPPTSPFDPNRTLAKGLNRSMPNWLALSLIDPSTR